MPCVYSWNTIDGSLLASLRSSAAEPAELHEARLAVRQRREPRVGALRAVPRLRDHRVGALEVLRRERDRRRGEVLLERVDEVEELRDGLVARRDVVVPVADLGPGGHRERAELHHVALVGDRVDARPVERRARCVDSHAVGHGNVI